MWVYPRDVIDQNRFHNCVGESEKAILVALAFKDAQPEMYTVTTFTSLIIQSGIESVFNDLRQLICKTK